MTSMDIACHFCSLWSLGEMKMRYRKLTSFANVTVLDPNATVLGDPRRFGWLMSLFDVNLKIDMTTDITAGSWSRNRLPQRMSVKGHRGTFGVPFSRRRRLRERKFATLSFTESPDSRFLAPKSTDSTCLGRNVPQKCPSAADVPVLLSKLVFAPDDPPLPTHPTATIHDDVF